VNDNNSRLHRCRGLPGIFKEGYVMKNKAFCLTVVIAICFYFIFIDHNECLSEDADFVAGKQLFILFPVKMRDQPSLSGNNIETLLMGETVIAISLENNWFKVKSQSEKIGYVAISWITDDTREGDRLKAKEKMRVEAENALIEQKIAQQKQNKIDWINYIKRKYPKWTKEDQELVINHKVKIGMNMEQCLEAWGESSNASNIMTKNGKDTQWCYGDFCLKSLYFHNGILTVIRTP
jgi:hypothetical protein